MEGKSFPGRGKARVKTLRWGYPWHVSWRAKEASVAGMDRVRRRVTTVKFGQVAADQFIRTFSS